MRGFREVKEAKSPQEIQEDERRRREEAERRHRDLVERFGGLRQVPDGQDRSELSEDANRVGFDDMEESFPGELDDLDDQEIDLDEDLVGFGDFDELDLEEEVKIDDEIDLERLDEEQIGFYHDLIDDPEESLHMDGVEEAVNSVGSSNSQSTPIQDDEDFTITRE